MSKITKVRVTSSSFIDRIAYDHANLTLSVMFTNGGVTQYFKVGHQVAKDFMVAESKGKFWNERIRDGYESQQAAS